MPDEVIVEERPGLTDRVIPRKTRRDRWPELYAFFDPDELAGHERPPDHVRVAFEELIGREPDFKIAWHPGVHRWGAFERVRDPKIGEGRYRCFSVFMEPAKADHLPADLAAHGKRYQHLRGQIGEFRLPHRRDFELIVEAGAWWRDLRDLVAAHEKPEDDREKEIERIQRDFNADMLDYYFLYVNTGANGGREQYSLPTAVLRNQNPERVEREHRNGYVLVRRRRDEKAEAEREATLVRAKEEAAELLRNDEVFYRQVKERIEKHDREQARRSAALAARAALTGSGPKRRL